MGIATELIEIETVGFLVPPMVIFWSKVFKNIALNRFKSTIYLKVFNLHNSITLFDFLIHTTNYP